MNVTFAIRLNNKDRTNIDFSILCKLLFFFYLFCQHQYLELCICLPFELLILIMWTLLKQTKTKQYHAHPLMSFCVTFLLRLQLLCPLICSASPPFFSPWWRYVFRSYYSLNDIQHCILVHIRFWWKCRSAPDSCCGVLFITSGQAVMEQQSGPLDESALSSY